GFSWAEHGEELLRRRKPWYHAQEPRPGVSVIGERLGELAAADGRRRWPRAARDGPRSGSPAPWPEAPTRRDSQVMDYSCAMDTPRSGKTRVTSVSLRAETLEAIRARAGKQGVSSYIEEAVQRQLQREAIDEYIATAEAEHGPVDQTEVAARADRIRAHDAA